MKTCRKFFLLFLIACLTIANLFEHGVAASRETNVSGVSQQQQYEHGFVAGYMQAYIDVCGNFDTIIPSIPKPDDGATSYADGYAVGKIQGQKDGDDNCPQEED